MLFNSIPFLFFCAAFFPLYFLSKGHARLGLCVIASYIFYGWWDWRFLGLIMISTLVDYLVGLGLSKTERPDHRRLLLLLSLGTNLGILGCFKYLGFFVSSFHDLMAWLGVSVSHQSLNVILPVGISFYTFQTLSYSIDVYRGKCAVEPSILRFAAYVALFPQLVAGPIVRARELLPQLRTDHRLDWGRIGSGLELIVWGFFLKLCLADTLALTVNPVYEAPLSHGAVAHIVATVFFAFQIYGDFCGYSLIAIGLGRMMGLEFPVNFRRPYFSRNFSEFWRRWHISLSSWLRDYLYIPLGGNRHGMWKTFRNLVIVMFLGGLWHGANYTFIIWGLLHGSYLVGQAICARWLMPVLNASAPIRVMLPSFQIATVFGLTLLAWVFFRAASLDDATAILSIIWNWANPLVGLAGDPFVLLKGAALILAVVSVDLLAEWEKSRTFYKSNPRLRAFAVLVALWSIAIAGTFEGAAFVYFQF